MGLTISISAGVAVADHGESAKADEIIEVQTVSTDGTEKGEQRVELGYHIGSDVVEMEVTVRDPYSEVVDTNGFSHASGNTYTWDEQTASPTIELVREANRSVSPHRGLDFVDAGEWTLTNRVPTDLGWGTFVDPESIERTTIVETAEAGSVGTVFAYLGEYNHASAAADDEQFDVVIADAVDSDPSLDSITGTLTRSSAMLNVGAKSESVTTFVVTDPIRRGGLATGANTDVWVHEASLELPRTTLWHEYVHTRQAFDPADTVEWSIEGEADYYASLLALKQGTIEYHDFHAMVGGADEAYDDVVLADPDTWEHTQADYELGALVVADLDREIRDVSGDTGSYEDVLRAKNRHGEDGATVTHASVEQFVSDAAGADLSEYLEDQVLTTPGTIDVPDPTTYDTGPDDATLELETTNLTVERGERASVRFELTNDGTERSLAPMLSPDLADEFADDSLSVDSTAGVESDVTRLADGFVFDHLEPGKTLVVEYEVLTSSDTQLDTYDLAMDVEDMGGNQARAESSIDVTATHDVTLDVPAGVPVDESIHLRADVTLGGTSLDGIRWEITGPTDDVIETADPELDYSFGEPGEYTVTVTVTNELGESETEQAVVLVSDRPEVTVDGPSEMVIGKEDSFLATVSNEFGETEIQWDAAGERHTGELVDLVFDEAGEQDVTVTVTDEYGVETTETITVTVRDSSGTGAPTADAPGDDANGPGMGVVTALVALVVVLGASRQRITSLR